MTYQTSQYKGDATYSICCTGDAVTGDEVSFERATFSGSFRNPKFAGFERVQGRIVRESYGRDKQQHTFTLLLDNGMITTIKGRNLYAEGTYRKPWQDEEARKAVQAEKYTRGNEARRARDRRKNSTY